MERFLYLRNVVTLAVDSMKCIGCGLCTEVCPHAVLRLDGDCVVIDERDACMECGACSRNCPTEAITVRAGVGCAAAIINAALGRHDACCCVVEEKAGAAADGPEGGDSCGPGCC